MVSRVPPSTACGAPSSPGGAVVEGHVPDDGCPTFGPRVDGHSTPQSRGARREVDEAAAPTRSELGDADAIVENLEDQAIADPHTGAVLLEREDRRTHLSDGGVEVLHRLLDALGHVRARSQSRGALQLEPDREETLDHSVMQVAGDAFAILQQEHVANATVEPRV